MKATSCLTLYLLANTTAAVQNWDSFSSRVPHRQHIYPNILTRRTSNQNSVRAGSEQLTPPARQDTDDDHARLALPKASSVPARFARADFQRSLGQESRKRQRPSDSGSRDRTPSPRRQRQSIAGSSPVRPAALRSGTHQSHSKPWQSELEDSSSSDSHSRSPSTGLLSLSASHSSADHSLSLGTYRRARANVRLCGPGVSVVASSQMYPEYSNIRTDESTSHHIKDPHYAKAAGASYQHEGAVVASAKGKAVKAQVDARRSKQGGRLTTSWHGQEPWHIDVKPGTTASLRYDESHTNGEIIHMKASLHGKGSVKASADQNAPKHDTSTLDQALVPEAEQE